MQNVKSADSLLRGIAGSNLDENGKATTHLFDELSPAAEREGFEPPVRFPTQRFSRPPQSTALPPLRKAYETPGRIEGGQK